MDTQDKLSSTGKTPEDLTREAVRQRMKEYAQTYNTGDVKNLAKFYSKDSFFVAPGRSFIRGPEGFLKCGIIKQMMDIGGKRIEIKEADIVPAKDSASVIATFLLFDDNNKELDDGRLVNVWVKTDGQWFLKYDIFN